MDSLKVGFFYDSARRDHECTLLGLEDAYRRAEATVSTFRADAQSASPPPRPNTRLDEDLVPFDAIALDLELAEHPILSDALFLLDSATNLTTFPWREGQLDRVACLDRIAAVDIRAWAYFRAAFNREIPLLPAPLPVFRALTPAQSFRAVIIYNDAALAHAAGPEIRRTLRRRAPDLDIFEISNCYRTPIRQSEWLAANLLNAAVHVHLGAPPDAISVGRLIDTMNMRVPCVVFEEARTRFDANAPHKWRRPVYVNDVNSVWVSSMKAFEEIAQVVVGDRSWAQSLTRNALREVAFFHEEVQNSLLPRKFVDNYLAGSEISTSASYSP